MEIAAMICIGSGFFFFLSGAIGILRFPDFYSRLHPAGKLDSAGVLFMMTGMALYVAREFTLESVQTALKIMLIVFFVFLTSPTATHAIIDAGFIAGMRPWTKKGSRNEKRKEKPRSGEETG